MPYHKICHTNDVEEGHGKKFVVEGQEIAVFKIENKFYAIGNICSHAGGDLSEGIVENKEVTCPLHAWKFSLEDGSCKMFDGAPGVKNYQIVSESGEVLVYIE
ncbi:MAG: nitrite reductase small subunit NirD [Candidatus Nanoarchaeia archaeon]|nr:nitrite reductase small subunit NirD [Candidatus Nanoarchaeia archaeon]